MVHRPTTAHNICQNDALEIHNGWTNMHIKARKQQATQSTITFNNQTWCDQACDEHLPIHKGRVFLCKKHGFHKKTRLFGYKYFLLGAWLI